MAEFHCDEDDDDIQLFRFEEGGVNFEEKEGFVDVDDENDRDEYLEKRSCGYFDDFVVVGVALRVGDGQEEKKVHVDNFSFHLDEEACCFCWY